MRLKPYFFMRGVGVAVLLWGQACTSASVPPVDATDDSQMGRAVNINANPRVLEVNLEAKPALKAFGTTPATPVWTYNGTVPAPLLEAHVGDTLIVHLKNSLPESTTIHWHGIRLPANMDGSPMNQAPVAPGASFDYSFVLKDPGLFWFHPHVRSDVQVNKGLYGAIVVRGNQEPAYDQEKILVLDDLKLKADGSIPDFLDDTSRMMGRGGDLLLLNGAANATLRARPNATLRLRIVNAANGRFFNLALAGTRIRVIGTDGGLVPNPYELDTLLMAPGERYDVLVRVPNTPGASLDLMTLPYDRGHDSGALPALKVATVRVEGAVVAAPAELPSVQAAIERLPGASASYPLVMDEKSLPNGEVVFTFNGQASPDIPMLHVPKGSVVALDLRNESEMDHPFHLHGFFFQVLTRNGALLPGDKLANKDTVIVPFKSSLRVVARFDEPGTWMYHCHILEHAEHGMMGEISVE